MPHSLELCSVRFSTGLYLIREVETTPTCGRVKLNAIVTSWRGQNNTLTLMVDVVTIYLYKGLINTTPYNILLVWISSIY